MSNIKVTDEFLAEMAAKVELTLADVRKMYRDGCTDQQVMRDLITSYQTVLPAGQDIAVVALSYLSMRLAQAITEVKT